MPDAVLLEKSIQREWSFRFDVLQESSSEREAIGTSRLSSPESLPGLRNFN